MLTAELCKDIDNKWEACWPVNTLKPLALIDCISYLLFFKKLEDYKLIVHYKIESEDQPSYITSNEELCWSSIENLDSKNIHALFYAENGIENVLKNYGSTNLPFSYFLKYSLIIKPSAVILYNCIRLIKLIESAKSNHKGEIFEYLLHKEEIQTTNGQLYAPADVINALVYLLQPRCDETIYDPSCGNGDLLIRAASYISNNCHGSKKNKFQGNIIGLDNDPVQLRIAAMNMILHNIEDPQLLYAQTFSESFNLKTELNQPALIISNLYFSNIENNLSYSTSQKEEGRKDIILLKNILKQVNGNGRAAVIIRNYILNNNFPEVSSIREQLIDNYKIEAIINLPDKPGSGFSGASVIIFRLALNESPDKIWFYKMKSFTSGFENDVEARFKNINSTVANEEKIFQYNPLRYETVMHKPGKVIFSERFCVPIEEIRSNNYNLFYSVYKKNNSVLPPIINNIKTIEEKEKVVVQRVVIQKILDAKNNLRLKLPASHEIIKTTLILILTLGFSVISLFFINKSKSTGNRLFKMPIAAPVRINNLKDSTKQVRNTDEKKILTNQEIKAILKDTSGVIHFEDKMAEDSMDGSMNDQDTEANVYPDFSKSFKKLSDHQSKPLSTNIKYIVTDTAYFHNEPNESTARKTYLDPHNQAILSALQDSNGFIYIVYTNKIKITSKGWIDKRYLKQVQ